MATESPQWGPQLRLGPSPRTPSWKGLWARGRMRQTLALPARGPRAEQGAWMAEGSENPACGLSCFSSGGVHRHGECGPGGGGQGSPKGHLSEGSGARPFPPGPEERSRPSEARPAPLLCDPDIVTMAAASHRPSPGLGAGRESRCQSSREGGPACPPEAPAARQTAPPTG